MRAFRKSPRVALRIIGHSFNWQAGRDLNPSSLISWKNICKFHKVMRGVTTLGIIHRPCRVSGPGAQSAPDHGPPHKQGPPEALRPLSHHRHRIHRFLGERGHYYATLATLVDRAI